MKFINLQKQYYALKKDIDKNIKNIIQKTNFILGDEVKLFEKKISKYVNSKFCVSVASGTDALLLSLIALGIKKNDEVITTNFSFISAVEVIKQINAIPVLIDINKENANIDAKLIEKKITKKTKAILFVNLFGNIVDYDSILKLAKKYKLKLIEDAAQSFGAKYKNKMSCNLGDLSCTSFFPTKGLGGYGDGGAIFCNNINMHNRLKELRNHGQLKKYQYIKTGFNSRLDTLQASILLAKLKYFKIELKKRKDRYLIYKKLLKKLVDKKYLYLLENTKGCIPSYSYFNIVVRKQRNQLEKYLTKNNVPFNIYYPKPLNKYKFLNISSKIQFPNSNYLSKKILGLPFDPYITKKEQYKVVNVIEKFYNV
tara:strand:+ start:1215 stop:2321 length:1107 start_codon:yes stop_codon:yes gene_type:complete